MATASNSGAMMVSSSTITRIASGSTIFGLLKNVPNILEFINVDLGIQNWVS